jgi:hypothetical protein
VERRHQHRHRRLARLAGPHQHQLGHAILSPYRLGDSENEAEHRLLVDRHLATLDIALARDAEQLLATQPSELAALSGGLADDELDQLADRALKQLADPAWAERDITAALAREERLLRALNAFMDRALRLVYEDL